MSDTAKIAELKSAKKLEYTYMDDAILFIEKRNGTYLANLHDPYTCTNCWDEPKKFDCFEKLIDYIVECQIKELEYFAESIRSFTKSVDITWDADKLESAVLERMAIVR